MKKPVRSRTGFTLIELMIALFIISVVIVSYVGANITAQRNSEEMHERTIAIQDANRAIEQIRDIAKPDTTFPDNVVAQYPNNTILPKVKTGGLTDEEIFNNLTDEEVKVSYESATTANPLEIKVTVTWSSYPQRDNEEVVRAYITQR